MHDHPTVRLADLGTGDLIALLDGPRTLPSTCSVAAHLVAEREPDRVVWVEYPGLEGAIATVPAFDRCETCSLERHGLLAVDSGVHICHPCMYRMLAQGLHRIGDGS